MQLRRQAEVRGTADLPVIRHHSIDRTLLCVRLCMCAMEALISLTDCQRFFLEPRSPKQRLYEALRAYFGERVPSNEAAARFGYTPGSFRVLCHKFRRDPDPQFFIAGRPGPRSQPKKSKAKGRIIELRKLNHSIYEISDLLKEEGLHLSPTAVREVLRIEGFAALPRRLDEERPRRPRPTVEPVADVRQFSLAPREFVTACGGLFLFIPDLVRLGVDQLAMSAHLPGSKMIPPASALRSALALKLWSIEHKSHVMAMVADEGLGLFAGLNAIPKRAYLTEYPDRVGPQRPAPGRSGRSAGGDCASTRSAARWPGARRNRELNENPG